MEIYKPLLLVSLLSSSTELVKGVVELSPSPVAPVCQEGGQLELTCNTTSGSSLDHSWEFTVFPENVTHTTRPVSSIGETGIPPPLTVRTSTITFSRLSGPNILSLISRVTVNPVSSFLNGTVVKCIDVDTDSVATTIIYIAGGYLNFQLDIQILSVLFSSDGISVVWEWSVSSIQIYYQQLLPENVSANVVPNPIALMHTGNRTLQLMLSYNTLYNVSITQPGICGQPNQLVFIELSYSKCDDPSMLIHSDVIALDYEDPALEGENITFTCPTGAILTGPNLSTCVENGQWEPDPREAECSVLTTSTIMPRAPDPSLATATIVQTLRTALISVTCVLVMLSALTFLIGFICGHCFSQRLSVKKDDESITEPREDLELKKNVAYITIHPK